MNETINTSEQENVEKIENKEFTPEELISMVEEGIEIIRQPNSGEEYKIRIAFSEPLTGSQKESLKKYVEKISEKDGSATRGIFNRLMNSQGLMIKNNSGEEIFRDKKYKDKK